MTIRLTLTFEGLRIIVLTGALAIDEYNLHYYTADHTPNSLSEIADFGPLLDDAGTRQEASVDFDSATAGDPATAETGPVRPHNEGNVVTTVYGVILSQGSNNVPNDDLVVVGAGRFPDGPRVIGGSNPNPLFTVLWKAATAS